MFYHSIDTCLTILCAICLEFPIQQTTKTALVTGANKGIGKEIVRQLATRGYKVFLGARDEERGKKAVEELRALGLNDVHFLSLDVTSGESVTNAATELATQISALDVLVNNAGISVAGNKGALEESIEEMKATYEVNIFGVVRTIQAFVPLMKKSSGGRIVNLGSSMGSLSLTLDPSQFFYPYVLIGYNSSKSALNSLTVSFAKTLAPFKIKVNTADPGYTATDFSYNQGHHGADVGAQSAVFLATLPDDGPTGSFYDKDGVVPW
jgi:NAD(P)-dependent dehydrogenase (short-subunit alcohol dehydrogenase family)